jgi:hypothetical protein
MQERNNLIVVLRRRGETRPEMRPVSRMRIDGHGNLVLWDTAGAEVETIAPGDFELLSIQTPEAITRAA